MTAGSQISLPSSSRALARSLTKSILRTDKQPEEHAEASSSPEPISQQTVPVESIDQTIVELTLSKEPTAVTDSLTAIRQQLDRSTVPEFLLHLPTMLVDYYFSYVCQIFSSFDGTLNPFRSTVGKLWDGSASIYYAIQSMAAAYLSHHFPRMAPVGIQMQRETYKCLYQATQTGRNASENLDKTLLTVLLVGQTTAWHNPKDLGMIHLKTAKRLNKRRIEQQMASISDKATRRQNEFFQQCILYWDMLAGYVEDDIDELDFDENNPPLSDSDSPPSAEEPAEKVFPHPWTGVSAKVQKLFAQVGRLVRSYRKGVAQETASSLDFLSLDLDFGANFGQQSIITIEATAKAQLLEEELLAFEPPSVCNLVDAGDDNTPVQQYILLAEAFRCAALLEIYRIFPTILSKRVPLANDFASSASSTIPAQLSAVLPFPSSPASQDPNDFLVSLAIHTLSLLAKIPSTSGTRCLQPIILICAASELRFSFPSADVPDFAQSNMFSSLTGREVDIADARRFASGRLQEMKLSLPAKPIVKALQVLGETWDRADLGQDCFWMDVMDGMGWKTIFG